MTDRDSHNIRSAVVRGNGLQRIVSVALLLALAPLLAGFAYLSLVRDDHIESQQAHRFSNAIARQQATQLHNIVSNVRNRLETAAHSGIGQKMLYTADPEQLDNIGQSLLEFFPELTSLYLIPISDMGTASLRENQGGLRNHIELDLVRRAVSGAKTGPETYRHQNETYTSLAQSAPKPGEGGQQIVILATFAETFFATQLETLDTGHGEVILQQLYGDKPERIAGVGESNNAGEAFRATHAVADTAWQITFVPADSMLHSLSVDPVPPRLALGLALLGLLAAVTTIILWFPRLIRRDVDRVIAGVGLNTQLVLETPQLLPLAEYLHQRETASRPAQPFEQPTPQAGEMPDALTGHHLTNPIFQRDNIMVDDSEIPGAPAQRGAGATPEVLPEHIFRAYDIRGHADLELTDETVYLVGRALGTLAATKPRPAMIVACDGRHSSPRIKQTMIDALLTSGCDVIDIGLVPTPLLYFATHHLHCSSGVMVTGSHNPAVDNGLKIVLWGHTIAAGTIQGIRESALAGEFHEGKGSITQHDIVPAYLQEIVDDINLPATLKVVVDAGNGATSVVAPQLFAGIGCEVVPLYCDIDGSFPNRSPDTSREENLADLAALVVREKAHFGVAFDGDGDRLAVVTASGRILRTDQLMMIYAQDVVSRNPGTDVVFDVKCSRSLAQLITEYGGRPVLWKTGHAFMKEKMAETGALLGGEFSGHIFFGERWYGFDDGIYAASRLAEILCNRDETLDTLMAAFPDSVNTPEILIAVPEDKKFSLITRFIEQARFPEGTITTLDGLRVDFNDGWGLLRASNTGAALTARFEASNSKRLEVIIGTFSDQLARIDPTLKIIA
ncbi:phosphomannomutase/phosphoglucomutase [Kineobactrum sediminis]|uniref:phosphomannomutase n=1 Tax=Kineobactrum sediminis TaxID=1905677 RepID=A0A2N5Y519_9GAMM|nr:phosphomannomutase/phosphoglucomutase [Kineobactrum sediminis]PLW83494.1 phosphomannomutase/phosphoglucomutase [Kineobactrum sediminis]